MSDNEKNKCAHDEHCDCDCEEEVLTLIDEDGKERDFVIIDVLEVEKKEYAILLPVEESEDEEDEAIILKFDVDEEGNELLVDIEDDEEWEKVADAWEELVAEEE